MKTVVKHFRQLGRQALSIGRYLHGDSPGEQRPRRYNILVSKEISGERKAGIRRGPAELRAELHDPLEISILSGDRDEYIDKSFWHDAEAAGVTFDESRVDGIWVEESAEMWK
jgi:hypothetical protein